MFDAGKIVSFGDPFCAERLRARLPELAPLAAGRPRDPGRAAPGRRRSRAQWILERPNFDLVVRPRPTRERTPTEPA